MTKTEKEIPSSIEQLHNELLLPCQPGLSLKFAKRRLIQHLGFTKATGDFNFSRNFSLDNPKVSAELFSYIVSETKAKHFLTIRAIDDEGKKGGGYPVVYILRPSDISKYLILGPDGILRGFKSTDGRKILWSKHLIINVFSRKRSVKQQLFGFDNYPAGKRVGVGGGFRLQLNWLSLENQTPLFHFSGVFVFNDVGPRATSLMSVYDIKTPHLILPIVLKYKGGFFLKAEQSMDVLTALESKDARKVASSVVDKLVENDGRAMAILFLSLLRVSPLPQQHSIEGIFSFVRDKENLILFGPEVYDFDGLDTIAIWRKGKSSTKREKTIKLEKITRAQLRYIEGRDMRQVLTLFYRGLQVDLLVTLKQKEIVAQIVNSVISHFKDFDFYPLDNEKTIGFISGLTGPVILGRLLKYFSDIPWQSSENGYFSIFSNRRHHFIRITVRGFDMAFWLRGENLVDTSNIREIKKPLAKALGKQILPAQINYLREGD